MIDRHPLYIALIFIALPLALSASLAALGCTADEHRYDAASIDEAPDYLSHAEPTDFEVGASASTGGKGDETEASFDRHDVISEALFLDTESLSVAEVQAFLEDSPYGGRSWLASETVAGRSAAAHLVEAARDNGISPVLLLSRLQVEQTLISQSARPSQYKVDRAMGCGCFDGQACFERYLGLDRQFQCAAETMRRRYDESVDGSGAWSRGRTRQTLDGLAVTPQNHATASMYAYTPWVLVNRGGNWLVWNITRRFMLHLQDQGAVAAPAWIGTSCVRDSDCSFTSGDSFGFCFDFVDARGEPRGFCSLPCEGTCPDRQGEATTFCVAADVPRAGICLTTPDPTNDHCAGVAGTTEQEGGRYVGTSGLPSDTRAVCAPTTP